MNRTIGIVAGLYILHGIVGFLPGLFLLLAVPSALAFWGLALRTATPPVGFDRFLEGMQVATLDAFPGFPFGTTGLGLLALHCLLSIPNLFGGFALARGKPAARERVLRLGALNLLAFPVGTALGLLTIGALARPEPVQARPAAPAPGMEEDWTAALCYLIPVLFPLYVLLGTRSRAGPRVHAIQSLALYLACMAVAGLGDWLVPLLGPGPATILTAAAGLVFLLLAALAYAGHAPMFAWAVRLSGRWQESAGALVEQAIATVEETLALELHRRRLASGDARPAADVLPKVAGKPGIHGFTQRDGGASSLPSVVMIAWGAIVIGFLVAKLAGDIARKGAASINWFVAIPALLLFVGIGSFLLFLLARSALSGRMNAGELSVARWPLRPGDESRVRFKGTTRRGAKVERIAAGLICRETIPYRDADGKRRDATQVVRSIAMPEVTPLAAADGSVTCDWTLRVPRDAAPTFAGSGGIVSWLFVVEMRVAGAPDGTLTFEALVVPGEAGP